MTSLNYIEQDFEMINFREIEQWRSLTGMLMVGGC